MKNFALAAAMLLAAFACDALAATLAGRVVGVSDGDTVTLLTAENRQFKIRLSGIDAPDCGMTRIPNHPGNGAGKARAPPHRQLDAACFDHELSGFPA
jgi:endonuclease YncB( thermonuclease family)